ncbi:MAG TPA: VOC family protein [Roseiarcus sp.]|nr:VOC family protein [Roseiarcus sp.]
MSEQKITPCLWFDFKAEEAIAHYLAIFADGRIVATSRYGEGGPGPKGAVMTILFEIEGQRFLALNGGPQFAFTPAISLIVDCADQAEVDRYWERLGEGGKPGQCGWLTDKFSVSWQIVPSVIPRIMQSGDDAGIERVMRAIMSMKKLDVAKIQQAFGPN